MPVSSQNSEYSKNLPNWQLVRDCNEGSNAIKSRAGGASSEELKSEGGTAYLPAPNPTDGSSENKARYKAYRDRANFVNFTGHTKEGMAGLVFRKETQVETDASIQYLIENANGGGLSTDQMIKDVTGDILLTGRYGLLVDYPSAPAGLTEAEVAALQLRANILPYPAESVVNWRTEVIGGVMMLSMVVLVEPTEVESEDEFEFKTVDYHRVLLLEVIDRKLTYIQKMYDENGEPITYEIEGSEEVIDYIVPRDFSGKIWQEIPFTFVGSINNDPKVDKAPLYDIAEVNIAHYRNSADFEESSFLVGQPTPVIMGLTQGWVDENMKEGIQLGSRAAILLPETGSATLLQADSNQMPEKGMEMKEQQMIKIGTRIIQDQTGNETAEAAKIRFTGQNSKLGSIIKNVEAAFTQCYEWAKIFMGGTGETTISINKEFYDVSIDPQMLVAHIQLMDRGVIAKADMRDLMRKGNLIDSGRTDDEIDSDAEETSPIE